MLQMVVLFILAFMSNTCLADDGSNGFHFYVDQSKNYHITYSNNWVVTKLPGAEYALQCNSIECGITTYITINTNYDPKMANQDVNHLIETADAQSIVKQFIKSNNISAYNILSSGPSTIGNGTIPVFHIQFTYTYTSGQNRISDLYLTFNKGRYYTISFLSTPENYQLEKILADKLLSTFAFNT